MKQKEKKIEEEDELAEREVSSDKEEGDSEAGVQNGHKNGEGESYEPEEDKGRDRQD